MGIDVEKETVDLIVNQCFDIANEQKLKYEKCISTIKKFDAGIIGMYDL